MDYPVDISFKIESDDLERDSNDNIQQLLFDVEIKVEKEVEKSDEADWCVTSFESCGDLLEPLFFKQVTEPVGPQCSLCYSYFTDGYAILEHNLTHLRVTIENPIFYQCDHCGSFFTSKQSVKRHITTHKKNISRTSTLSYKPKAYKPNTEADYEIKFNMSNKLKTYKAKQSITDDCKEKDKIRYKPKDGMTNLLKYKPKSSKFSVTLQNCDFKDKLDKNKYKDCKTEKMRQCNICKKTYTYKHWHAHMQQVHGSGGYFCGPCDIEFKCERYFLRHMNQKHTKRDKEKKKYSKGAKKLDIKCDLCDAVLTSSYALTTHKRNVHSSDKHVCHICNSKLKCRSYLLAHLRRVHCSDGKHACECGKSFKSRRYLMVHKRNAHSKK